jgi:hypothetical protein
MCRVGGHDVAGGDKGLETEDESGEVGADESEDTERWSWSGLCVLFRDRRNAAAGASSKTGASCGPAALTAFPLHFRPRPRPPPPLSAASIPANLPN